MRFKPSDRVRVHDWQPPGHVRTPYFARGKSGVVESVAGVFHNPEELAYGRPGDPEIPLYRVAFEARDLWPEAPPDTGHSVVIDVFEHWLELET